VSLAIQIKNHPFRFLLYLEWILLVVAALTEALPPPLQRLYRFPLLTVLCIVGFGFMGLRMPTGKHAHKVLYTSLEILLIFLAAIAGGRNIRLFPLLYVILVIRSCLIFKLPGRLAVTGLSFTLFLLTLFHRFQRLPAIPALQERLRFTLLSFALLFGLSLVFVLLLMNAVLAERQSREKLAVANQQLRQYALRIEDQATLHERNRIARDIHDSLGHSLTALNLQLETALKLWSADPTTAVQFLAQAKQLGSQALQEVRQSVSTLRYDPLQGRSLAAAVADLAEEFYRSTGVLPTWKIPADLAIPSDVATAIYRVIQEALTNASKYAHATEVKIQLRTAADIHLTVEDNGRGFRLDQNSSGFGLQSMRDRTLALGGQFQIDSAFNSGCRITAQFPLVRLSP